MLQAILRGEGQAGDRMLCEVAEQAGNGMQAVNERGKQVKPPSKASLSIVSD
jgi:hypothetical protein